MQKYEERAESMLKRLHRNFTDLGPQVPLDVSKKTPEQYLQQFEWDIRKYPAQNDLTTMAGQIFNDITDMDNDIKGKQADLTAVGSRLNAIQRKRSGNLVTRDLSDLIKHSHYVRDEVSKEYSTKIVPYFIVVSVHREKDFLDSYERFTQFVVPKSALEVPSQDKDYKLFRILHLNAETMEDDLKTSCEQHKFTFRKFEQGGIEAAQQTSHEEQELITEQKRLTGQVIQYIKSNFSEMFVSYMHLKAIRVFVESVLWYSLPPNFQVMLIQPNERNETALRQKLAQQFQGAKCSQVVADESEDNHPYVSMDLELDWLLGEE